MNKDPLISSDIVQATEISLQRDPDAKEINDISIEIDAIESELDSLKAKLYVKQKRRQDIAVKWRNDAIWCLEVDSNNPRYFLKSAAGVYKCIAFKHKIEINPDMKNKVTITLASLFKEKKIGRIKIGSSSYYGLTKFFKDDLGELTNEARINIDKLIL